MIYSKDNRSVYFEFYLINLNQIIDFVEEKTKLNNKKENGNLNIEENSTKITYRDYMDVLWILTLRILQLFEETISTMYPSIIFYYMYFIKIRLFKIFNIILK